MVAPFDQINQYSQSLCGQSRNIQAAKGSVHLRALYTTECYSPLRDENSSAGFVIIGRPSFESHSHVVFHSQINGISWNFYCKTVSVSVENTDPSLVDIPVQLIGSSTCLESPKPGRYPHLQKAIDDGEISLEAVCSPPGPSRRRAVCRFEWTNLAAV